VTDIFREVEEEVRRERLEKLWKQYGDYVIAFVAAVIIGIAAFELYQRYEANQRAKASAEFDTAMTVLETNPAQAVNVFAKLASSSPSGYATLADFAQADALLASGDRGRAVGLFEAIAEKDKGPIGGAARIRAAWAVADTTSKADLEILLAPLTDPASPWRPMAREILAYSDYRAGQFGLAAAQYRALAADTGAPQALRARAGAMAAYLKAGGDSNFGYVPPLPTQMQNAPPPGGQAPPSNQQGAPSQ
jgi:hypothetical protein